jgi:hypothetical protein
MPAALVVRPINEDGRAQVNHRDERLNNQKWASG